jgi:hypothetical protein
MYVEELVDGVYKRYLPLLPSALILNIHHIQLTLHSIITQPLYYFNNLQSTFHFYFIHTYLHPYNRNDPPINLLRSINRWLRLRRPSPLRMRQDNCRAMRLQQEICS